MVAGMETNLTDKQRNTTCGKNKVEQLKSRHISGESQGRHLYDSCVSALGFLENQLFGEMEEAGEEVCRDFKSYQHSRYRVYIIKSIR